MKRNFTPLHCKTSKESVRKETKPMPEKETLQLIKQFARVYYGNPLLQDQNGSLVLN